MLIKKIANPLTLPMQFFAGAASGSEGTSATETKGNNEHVEAENGGGDPKSPAGTEPQVKTFTQEEVDRIIADRLARQAKQSEKKFTQKEVDDLISEKLSEADKLAKMNAEQKAKYAQEKHEKELADREAALTKRELTATAKEVLVEKGLPAELADIVDTTSAENCTASIETIEKAFSAAVQKAVNDRVDKLKNNPPKAGDSNTGNKNISTLVGALSDYYSK